MSESTKAWIDIGFRAASAGWDLIKGLLDDGPTDDLVVKFQQEIQRLQTSMVKVNLAEQQELDAAVPRAK
jgi:hypothetical protein